MQPTIQRRAPWAQMRAAFRWKIPAQVNIAQTCCFDWAARAPERAALIDLHQGRRVWTYGELAARAEALAASLHAQGVGRGDRVAILLPQRAEVMVAHFAAMRLGAVSLPLFTLFGPDALHYRLSDSGAKAVIAQRAALDSLAGLDLPALTVRIDVDALPQSGRVPLAQTAAEDPAMMIYTSGTTGDPKGVLHAHRFLYGHLPCVETGFEGFPQPGDIGWTPADWAWIGGLMDLAMPCLAFGVPVVAHRMRKFDPASAWHLMAQEGVSVAFLPPTALKRMRQEAIPDGLRLRAVISGGEALGADLLAWGRDALGVPINEIYGQTEVNLVMAACAGTQEVIPGTLGQPVPGVEVTVQDAQGAPVAQGEVGEICVRGSPAAFLRYWGKPAKTAEKWRDGWLRTGDLGVALGAGGIRYHGRDDDVITSAGYRIGPSEIETCLSAHPEVVLAAVVGLPDPDRGEAVTAFVVAAPRDGLEQELQTWVRDRLSPHMVPRAVNLRESLPMTSTGKIMRRALRSG